MGFLCVLEVEPVEARLLVERRVRRILQIIFLGGGWRDGLHEVDVKVFERIGRWTIGTVLGSRNCQPYSQARQKTQPNECGERLPEFLLEEAHPNCDDRECTKDEGAEGQRDDP